LRWDQADYPMLIAEVEHRNWVAQVSYATKQGQPVPHRRVGDLHFCRFGRWYDGPGAERYGSLTAFQEIALAHQQVHELAERIDGHMRDGRPDEARAMIARLVEQEERVLVLLRRLQLEVATRR
jgi:hypothetical protein